tara:strand:- start:216 stop:533 length:318 start_codon:yes stop_codon:yes gene_type:complete
MKSENRPVLSASFNSRRVDASKSISHDAKKPAKQSNRRQLEQHEASLVPLIRSKTPINIVMIDGERLYGVCVIGFDRYSIAIEYDGFRETVFKSAIARIITPVEV